MVLEILEGKSEEDILYFIAIVFIILAELNKHLFIRCVWLQSEFKIYPGTNRDMLLIFFIEPPNKCRKIKGLVTSIVPTTMAVYSS